MRFFAAKREILLCALAAGLAVGLASGRAHAQALNMDGQSGVFFQPFADVVGAEKNQFGGTTVSVHVVDAGPVAGDYINAAAFSAAPEFTFGNIGRTINMRGPGQANFDMSLFKNFAINESQHVQFRAEAFNTLNHPNFYLPENDLASPDFGQILQAAPPRLLQLAIKFIF